MKANLKTITLNDEDGSIPLSENRPFVVSGDRCEASTGILLIHGFTGSPWEMREIGCHLAEQGHLCLGVRLPGHGTSAADLADRSLEEWVESVEQGYRYLQQKTERVIGIGLSTGALLLLATAGRNNNFDFAGLALLSPYLSLRQRLAGSAFWLRHFVRYHRRPIRDSVASYYYAERPLAGVHQINRLLRRVRKQLASIETPAMIACAAGDRTVRPESAIELYNRLGSAKKEYYRFGNEVPHVLTTADNPRQQEILRISSNFVDSVTSR